MGARGRRIAWGAAIVVALGLLAGLAGMWLLRGAEHAAYWEDAIVAFEELDRRSAPPPGAIVFTGSSSVRMWKTLDEDMAPRIVLNRGFGGAHLDHVDAFASRIVLPYAPRAVVLYAGDNDIASGKDAERVVADFDHFVATIRAGGSDVPILFVAIKPSRLRFDDWPEMARANAAIAARCAADPKLHYIDIATPMLAEAEPGEPPPRRLFIIDGLHLSDEGYALWTRVVRSALDEVLGAPGA